MKIKKKISQMVIHSHENYQNHKSKKQNLKIIITIQGCKQEKYFHLNLKPGIKGTGGYRTEPWADC